eukprot:TRINITY_DN10613_c0_g1_i1.p1 TRINITY_DN10613_c0_g1~~TRINITY_DN10613_c0_g1_i1.p1  ORF type:complete len:285 (+),score=39.55 TRINITY_DN10613_c0_g1_i1:144-998(+)
MSIIISDPNQIFNSPLNSSTAKQLYSFPKGQRFKDLIKPSHNGSIYELPSMREKRAASFGYGSKYDFTKDRSNSPPPGSYNVRREPSAEGNHWSIGLSRDVVTGSLATPGKNVPGPGTYNLKGRFSPVAYTMRPRTSNPDELVNTKNAKQIPGPGKYEAIPAITKDGKHFVANFKNTGMVAFNPPRSKRFNDHSFSKEVPGPGAYDTKPAIDSKGNYFISKFESSGCRTFNHEKRNVFSLRARTPGPGTYRMPSDFGYYESKYSQQAEATERARSRQKTGESKL